MARRMVVATGGVEMHSALRMSEAAKNEDSLGVILRGHFMLGSILRTMLSLGMRFPMSDEVYKGLSLSTTAQLCVGLGLMPAGWLLPVRVVIDMRNDFAHKPTHDLGDADVGALIGALPRLGKEIYKARGRSETMHRRIANVFFVMLVALNAHVSVLKSDFGSRPRKVPGGRPPADALVRGIINIRNKDFQIAYLDPADDPRRKQATRKKRSPKKA